MTVRLTHEATGVAVSVSEDTAARLGSEWKSEKPKAAPKASSKRKSEKSE